MAEEPSDEEVLQAVERYLARHRITTRLSVPGAASLAWRSVLECQVHRSIERRKERPQQAKGPRGRNKDIADRPSYTDLDAYPVEPPADPSRPQVVRLVREGSLDEVACEGCVGGRKDCDTCEGRGGTDCPAWVECEVCRGGPDACWECDGTGTPRTRRARTATRPRREGAPARAARCRRCDGADVACPKCSGEWKWRCPTCKGKGLAPCDTCKGAKRVTHRGCDGTGRLTVWTEGVITHTPDLDRLEPVYPRFSRLKTGQWRTAELTSATGELPDFLEDAHLKQVTPLLAVKEREVRRRVRLRYLPLARVQASADPHHVYYAFPALSGDIEVIRRFSRRRLVALAWAAVAVAVVAVVVTVTVLR
ncbi:hypothetical protein [Streptomyces sp. NPDC014995]|uniref:hypothetical protein n=1 Tax=Streptomyces sp. NPDC014995 TaxID=3364936 RepID=UPI0036F8A644